jgi:hypothetical protein
VLGEQPEQALIERAIDQIILPAVRPQAADPSRSQQAENKK